MTSHLSTLAKKRKDVLCNKDSQYLLMEHAWVMAVVAEKNKKACITSVPLIGGGEVTNLLGLKVVDAASCR